jgi:hypothetical protein
MPLMTQAHPPLTPSLIDAFIASAVLWLMRLLGVILHPSAPRRRRRLVPFVRRLERFVELILFLQAVHAYGPLPPKPRARPLSAPPGFRRVQRRFTLFWKIARIRAPRGASLADRLGQLLNAIANPARYVARFMKRLCKGLRGSRLIPCVPPALTLTPTAAPAPAFPDTS